MLGSGRGIYNRQKWEYTTEQYWRSAFILRREVLKSLGYETILSTSDKLTES